MQPIPYPNATIYRDPNQEPSTNPMFLQGQQFVNNPTNTPSEPSNIGQRFGLYPGAIPPAPNLDWNKLSSLDQSRLNFPQLSASYQQTPSVDQAYGSIDYPGAQPAPQGSIGSFAQAGIGAAAKGLSDIQQTMGTVAANQYAKDIERWKAEGKYWMDPNSDIKPTLDKYLSQQPSQTDALMNSNLIAYGSKNPTVAGQLLNPASAFGKKAGYIGGSAGTTALSFAAAGAVGGAAAGSVVPVVGTAIGAVIGGVVGAVVGVLKGVMEWDSAEGEDAKQRAQAQREYEMSLRTWQNNRFNKQAEMSKTLAQKEIAQEQINNAKKIATANTKRGNMMKIMSGISNSSKSNFGIYPTR